jgi:hypothetical protein
MNELQLLNRTSNPQHVNASLGTEFLRPHDTSFLNNIPEIHKLHLILKATYDSAALHGCLECPWGTAALLFTSLFAEWCIWQSSTCTNRMIYLCKSYLKMQHANASELEVWHPMYCPFCLQVLPLLQEASTEKLGPWSLSACLKFFWSWIWKVAIHQAHKKQSEDTCTYPS